jgi:hypothetical protein
MTVQNTIVKNVYVGNGSVTVFPYTFALNNDDGEYVKVVVTDETGAETEVSNYRVDTTDTTVTYPYPSGDPLPSGHKITLKREIPNTQELNLENQGPFFAKDIEMEFDRVVMMIQQLGEMVGRAVKVSVSSSETPDEIINSIFESKSAAMQAAENASISETNAGNSAIAASGSAGDAANSKTRAEEILADIEAAAQTVGGIATVYDPNKQYQKADQVMIETGETYRCIQPSLGEYPPTSGKWILTATGTRDTFERDSNDDLMPVQYAQASDLWDIDEDENICPRYIA